MHTSGGANESPRTAFAANATTRWVVAGLLLLLPLAGWATYAAVFAEAPGDAVREIDVIITDFTYIPAIITLQEGEPVKMVVTNEGRLPHDYVIDGLGQRVATAVLQSGETEILEFTPEKTGRLEIFCTIPGHQEMGLVTGGVIQ